MARDYRYGHKVKKPTVRRTQEAHEPERLVEPKIEPKSDKKLHPAPKTAAARAIAARAKQASAEALEVPRVSSQRSAETQKIIDEACRASLPNTIRKAAEQREAQARLEAEALAQAQAKLQALAQEKKQARFSWGIWSGLTLLILSGVAWLLYAPFFLAFAFEMHWIDEATRNRLDPASAMRAQAVVSLTKEKQEPVKPVAAASAVALNDAPVDLQYSFYRELPKANIVTAAQPLPVRTRAPTYLQLASIANEKEAQAERRRLAQKGYLVQMTAQVNKGQTVYVLRMGPYEDQRVINRLKVEFQRLGVDAHEISVLAVVKAAETQPAVKAETAPLAVKVPSVSGATSRADAQQKAAPSPR